MLNILALAGRCCCSWKQKVWDRARQFQDEFHQVNTKLWEIFVFVLAFWSKGTWKFVMVHFMWATRYTNFIQNVWGHIWLRVIWISKINNPDYFQWIWASSIDWIEQNNYLFIWVETLIFYFCLLELKNLLFLRLPPNGNHWFYWFLGLWIQTWTVLYY